MRSQSFGSVEITWLDREAVRRAVKRAAEEMARRRPEVLRVVLFGSLARGTAVPGSDADILVVLSKSGQPFKDRMSTYRLKGLPVGVDTLAYTEAEMEALSREGNAFVKEALAEGIVMYERPSGPC